MDTRKEVQDREQLSQTESAAVDLLDKVISIFGWVVKFILIMGLLVTIFYVLLAFAPSIIAVFVPAEKLPEAFVSMLQAGQESKELVSSIYDQFGPFVERFWDFLQPLLQLAIVAIFLRWLFFPRERESPLMARISGDTPSMVAVFVIAMLSLVTILGISIPSSLVNISLIVLVIFVLRWLLFPEGKPSGLAARILGDIPSIIAVLVISTICLVVVLGVDLPDVLANVALVIVGFYFGKERLEKETSKKEMHLEENEQASSPSEEETNVA